MFSAYSESKVDLQKVFIIFKKIAEDEKLLVQLLENYEEGKDEIWSTDEFLDHLDLNEIDRSEPIFFHFHIEFDSEESSKGASIEASNEGYVCYLGQEYDNYPVAACITSVPSRQFLDQTTTYFGKLAKKYEGKFEYYDFKFENDFEELEHWLEFEKSGRGGK